MINPLNPLKFTQFRVTFPDVYPEGSPGHSDARARQGHYVHAHDAEEAQRKVRNRLGLKYERTEAEAWT